MVRVLTVDDSTSMRQMIKFTLQNAGIEVIEASDGFQALDWAQKNAAPDLVLADVNMPVMDGIALIKHLRELKSYKTTPILMLTTDSSKDRKLEGKETGANGWIVKPFNPEQLVNVIQKLINPKSKG